MLHGINLRRGQAVTATGFQHLAFSLELALQFQRFGGEAAGGFDGAGVFVARCVKAGGELVSIVTLAWHLLAPAQPGSTDDLAVAADAWDPELVVPR